MGCLLSNTVCFNDFVWGMRSYFNCCFIVVICSGDVRALFAEFFKAEAVYSFGCSFLKSEGVSYFVFCFFFCSAKSFRVQEESCHAVARST